MARKTDEEWLEMIQECRASGLTDRQWCISNDVSFSTFYYHVKDLRKKACTLPVSVSTKNAAPVKQDIAPVTVIDSECEEIEHQIQLTKEEAAVRIHVKNIQVDIMNDASADVIRNTLLAIGGLC